MPLLVLAFIVVPILELYVIIQVGQLIGVLATIALLLADSLLGSLLMRSQGRLAWRRFNLAVAQGRPPTREVVDGVLVIFGGAFLLTPGFLTDVLGIGLLAPPTRAVFRAFLLRNFASRLVVGGLGWGAGRAAGARSRRRAGRPSGPSDVDGTAEEVAERDLRRLP